MTFYKNIADWYDTIFPPCNKQQQFIELISHGTDNKVIADIGCSTGNLALQLSHKAKFVTGIDPNKQLLEKGLSKINAETNIAFIKGRMEEIENYFKPNSVDIITCMGNGIPYLLNPNKMFLFFQACRRILTPKGRLIIETLNYNRIQNSAIIHLPIIENEKLIFKQTFQPRDVDQLINFKSTLVIKESGDILNNTTLLYPLRQQLITKLLNEAGFKNLNFYSDFTGVPLRNNSLNMVMYAT